MTTSENGLLVIERFERFMPRLYNCPAGDCTIAYGHLVHMGKIDGRDSEQPYVGGVTLSQALALLIQDCGYAEHAIAHLVTVPLNQNQFDALVSFTFNLGAGALQKSTLLKLLNQGNYAAVPAQMMKYIWANHQPMSGLVMRRSKEAMLFSEPIPA